MDDKNQTNYKIILPTNSYDPTTSCIWSFYQQAFCHDISSEPTSKSSIKHKTSRKRLGTDRRLTTPLISWFFGIQAHVKRDRIITIRFDGPRTTNRWLLGSTRWSNVFLISQDHLTRLELTSESGQSPTDSQIWQDIISVIQGLCSGCDPMRKVG